MNSVLAACAVNHSGVLDVWMCRVSTETGMRILQVETNENLLRPGNKVSAVYTIYQQRSRQDYQE